MRLRVPKPNKLLPPTHIRIEFCMKYQISGFLTGTQILASLSPPGLIIFSVLTDFEEIIRSGSSALARCQECHGYREKAEGLRRAREAERAKERQGDYASAPLPL